MQPLIRNTIKKKKKKKKKKNQKIHYAWLMKNSEIKDISEMSISLIALKKKKKKKKKNFITTSFFCT